ncbi:hypothetical protein NliqN6_0586 [Naganishia liquefaciens]|uniref:Uncharacterized protein n=1 Tax=Naganishia liquefaciens TaxID=104408 RepID=A0A8H3TPY7_9TREE|nr:hypothetical protein NliqN6_0586 [Naganishia liquefaciens]
MMFRRLASSAAEAVKLRSKPIRQTKRSRQQYEHSVKLAQQLASTTTSDGSDLSALTDSVHAIANDKASSSGADISLETLETYRPTRAAPIHAPLERYAKEYGRAFARLDKAFLRPQLRELWDVYSRKHAETNSNSGSSTSNELKPLSPNRVIWNAGKRQIVAAFLESWGWPRVEVLEKEREVAAFGNTVEAKDIPMTSAEAYLLLRRDPEFTRVLVSEQRVSLTMVTQPTLCFRIKGRNKILREVETALETRRKNIHVERVRKSVVPGSSLTELYQPISDMSGAFLETDPRNDQYAIISYLEPASRDQALHLLCLANNQLELEPEAARVLALVGSELHARVPHQSPVSSPSSPSEPETYALYPFISTRPTIPSSTPQQAGMASPIPHRDWALTGKNLYRVRRLGGWFGSLDQGRGKLQDVSKVLAFDAESRKHRKGALLHDWLKESRSSLESEQWSSHQFERHVNVRTGHLLYRTKMNQPSAILTPPPALQGDHSLGRLCRNLLDANMRPVFVPTSSLPTDANVQENAKAQRVRRARYRSTLPAAEGGWISTIDIEVDLPITSADASKESAGDENESSPSSSGEADAVIRRTHRRSWFVMCPDSDHDLEIQEHISRKLDLTTELSELNEVLDGLRIDPTNGILPLQLELAESNPYTLIADDTVIASTFPSKEAVGFSVDTVEASRTFSSAGTILVTKAAFKNINAALQGAGRSA